MDLNPRDALIVVDVQNDFLPGGALPVAHGNEVIAPLNECIRAFQAHGLPVFATRDWHPADHCSFRSRGGPWPSHCIAGTAGAAFAKALALPAETRIISKATSSEAEAYSGFEGTSLSEQLRALDCRRVLIGGLATDYCVKRTALDACAFGLQVVVLSNAVRAVDAQRGDGQQALSEMRARGVRLVSDCTASES